MFIRFGSMTTPTTQQYDVDHQPALDRQITIRPETNILETTKGIELFIEMPGVGKDRIGLTVENNVLTVIGSREEYVASKQAKYLLQEREGSEYKRSWKLNTDLDSEKIDAQYEHGVLHVTVPEKAEMRPRSISVQ